MGDDGHKIDGTFRFTVDPTASATAHIAAQEDKPVLWSGMELDAAKAVLQFHKALKDGDNATVKTFGNVNFLSLNVILTGNAKADINTNTVSLTTAVKDNANLNLAGSTTDFYATMGTKAALNMAKFKADNASVNSIAPIYAKALAAKKVTLESIGYADELAK